MRLCSYLISTQTPIFPNTHTYTHKHIRISYYCLYSRHLWYSLHHAWPVSCCPDVSWTDKLATVLIFFVSSYSLDFFVSLIRLSFVLCHCPDSNVPSLCSTPLIGLLLDLVTECGNNLSQPQSQQISHSVSQVFDAQVIGLIIVCTSLDLIKLCRQSSVTPKIKFQQPL